MFKYYITRENEITICIFCPDSEGNSGPREEAKHIIKAACTHYSEAGWNGFIHYTEGQNSVELFYFKMLDAIQKKMPKVIVAKTTLRGNDVYNEEEGKEIAKAKCLKKFYSKLYRIFKDEDYAFMHDYDIATQRIDEVLSKSIIRNDNKIRVARLKGKE